MDGKILGGNTEGRGFQQNDLLDFVLNAGQSDQTSPGDDGVGAT